MSEHHHDPFEEIPSVTRWLEKRFSTRPHFDKRLFLLLLGMILAVLALSSSAYTVDPHEKAVILRMGCYKRITGPGLHLKIPFGAETVMKVPTELIQQEEFGFRSSIRSQPARAQDEGFHDESSMLTGDLNVAEARWIVQYKISEPRKFLFHVRDVRKNLRDVSQSVVRRVVGDRRFSEVLTIGRVEIAEESRRHMQKLLDRYDIGVRVIALKLQDVNPPAEVWAAFNDVNSAKQEQEKTINIAEGEYNRVIPEARGKAQQEIFKAEGYAAAVVNRAGGDAARFQKILEAYRTAPQVTRTRLYLETLEEVYGRLNGLTVIDVNVAGVLPLFGDRPEILGGVAAR